MTTLTPVPTRSPSAASRAHLAATLGSNAADQAARAWSTDGPAHATAAAGPDPLPDGLPSSLRVGVDLVVVADVAESVARLGRRYLYRVFTPHERACARIGVDRVGGSPSRGGDRRPSASGYSMESLAGRFAAKEAALKVLRPEGARPEWRSIEVRRVAGGWCELRLSGTAESLATEAGITSLAVSVTHEPMVAAACVVGMRRGDAPAWRRMPPPDRRGK